MKKIDEVTSRYFLRMQVDDQCGVLASISSVFGSNGVSLAQVIQKAKQQDTAELVVITEGVVERHFADSLKILKGLSIVKEISAAIRVYGD